MFKNVSNYEIDLPHQWVYGHQKLSYWISCGLKVVAKVVGMSSHPGIHHTDAKWNDSSAASPHSLGLARHATSALSTSMVIPPSARDTGMLGVTCMLAALVVTEYEQREGRSGHVCLSRWCPVLSQWTRKRLFTPMNSKYPYIPMNLHATQLYPIVYWDKKTSPYQLYPWCTRIMPQ